MLSRVLYACLAAGVMAAGALPVRAADTSLSFQAITHNDPSGNAGLDGAASLHVVLSDLGIVAGVQQVRFLFTNDSDYSSLTDVYFDNGSLLGISNISGSGYTTSPKSGVKFSLIATPSQLPGGSNLNPDFDSSDEFSADSDAPVSHYGVQNSDQTGEWLAIDFALKNGKTYADTLAALQRPWDVDNGLRVGAHVQAYAGGYSESFVNAVPTWPSTLPVPESDAYTLVLLGAGIVAAAARRHANLTRRAPYAKLG